MTWGRLKLLTKGLLSGDYYLPEDEEERVALLQMAMEEVCNHSSPVTLYYKDTNIPILKDREVIREFQLERDINDDTGMAEVVNGFIMRPLLPATSNDVLDMDEGLTYALARLMASYLSNLELKAYHREEAYRIIEMYQVNVVSLYDRWNKEESS